MMAVIYCVMLPKVCLRRLVRTWPVHSNCLLGVAYCMLSILKVGPLEWMAYRGGTSGVEGGILLRTSVDGHVRIGIHVPDKKQSHQQQDPERVINKPREKSKI
jgi:hypothetical protein